MLELLARAYLKAGGWTVVNELPDDLDKFVIIAAPHTSNWDFPVTMALAATVDMKFYWVGKHTLFRPPFGRLMRALGGIPVDRRKSSNFVEQIAREFDRADRLALGIAPEGTRSKAEYWKSGFYHIAHLAGVPIVCGFVDFKRKVGGLGRVIDSSQSKEAVLAELRDFYDGIEGKRPENFTPPRFRER
ncbi:MAG: lysophospholipid acyltransferase family protein [Persicimonas sp.]